MEHFRLNVVGVNAVILLGGKPVDQDDDNLSTPRILVNVSGKPVIQWLLDSVCLNANDTLHLVYHAEMERYPAFLEVMERAKSTQGVVAHPLFVDTRGPVETVLSLLQRMDATFLESPMITLDADTFYESDIVGKFREFCTDNCIFYSDDTDVSGPAVCSYIKTDSNLNGALVTQIKEKERISSNANTGAYGFKSGQLLLEYSRRVVDVQSSKGITTG
jgi:NDP-sugar pyrophosphorylase family protein